MSSVSAYIPRLHCSGSMTDAHSDLSNQLSSRGSSESLNKKRCRKNAQSSRCAMYGLPDGGSIPSVVATSCSDLALCVLKDDCDSSSVQTAPSSDRGCKKKSCRRNCVASRSTMYGLDVDEDLPSVLESHKCSQHCSHIVIEDEELPNKGKKDKVWTHDCSDESFRIGERYHKCWDEDDVREARKQNMLSGFKTSKVLRA